MLLDIHLGQRAIAFSVGIGFAVGTLAGGVLWLAGRRLLGTCVGILACSFSIVAYVVLGLGIPLEWIIQ
ncbi:MAG: hypothetical protein CMJ48_04865 [Planctomycetaceae bacterium]|nr:hypothetical protein [Planctomycetaceae bacterium]